jgi:hypothetical protein
VKQPLGLLKSRCTNRCQNTGTRFDRFEILIQNLTGAEAQNSFTRGLQVHAGSWQARTTVYTAFLRSELRSVLKAEVSELRRVWFEQSLLFLGNGDGMCICTYLQSPTCDIYPKQFMKPADWLQS